MTDDRVPVRARPEGPAGQDGLEGLSEALARYARWARQAGPSQPRASRTPGSAAAKTGPRAVKPEPLARRWREAVVERIAAFRASGNPELLPDLERHAREHAQEWQRLLFGGAIGDFEFVRTHARRRATQRFPLEALLQAYRCLPSAFCAPDAPASGRAVGGARRASPGGLDEARAELAQEYAAAAGIVAAAAYVEQTRWLVEAEGDRRNELLGILLSGYDEADARVARLLKRAGYLEQRLSFCVVLAQSTDPLEMESPARAQRIVDALAGALAPLPVRVLVGLRGNLVTALVSDVRRASGWTPPQATLAERIRPPLQTLGLAVLTGLSSDQPSTAFIPRGLHEATVALDFSSVTERVVSFAELPLRRLLIHRGADYVQQALPPWLPRLRAADAKAGGALLTTLRVLADADINVQGAARRLGLHPNTVYARLARVADLSGLDAQRYHELSHLLLVADCARP